MCAILKSRACVVIAGFAILLLLGLLVPFNGFNADAFPQCFHDASGYFEIQTAVSSSLSHIAADTIRHLAMDGGSDFLSKAADDIDAHALRLRATSRSRVRRQSLTGALGSLLGGGGSSTSQNGSTANSSPTNPLGNLLGGSDSSSNGSSIISAIGSALSGGLGSIGDSLLNDLNGPALFLGIGLGMGTASGLNLSTKEQAEAVANNVAAENGMNRTGLNNVALNLGNGLTSEALPLVANGNATGNTIAPAVFSLAQGIGNGTAQGLGFSKNRVTASNGSSIPEVAGNFGLGVSESLAQNLNLTRLTSSASSRAGSQTSGINIPAIAAGAGQGLGRGSAEGLGLTKSEPKLAAGSSSDDKQQAASMVDQLPAAASGFMEGLSSSFLGSASLSTLKSKFSTGAGTINVPMVAVGLARGLIDGAASGASSAGGVSNLVNGNFSTSSLQRAPLTDDDLSFNDTVGGAAIAFGQGLGNEGVLAFGALMKKGSLPKLSKRLEVDVPSNLYLSTNELSRKEILPSGSFVTRATETASPAINSTTLSSVSQLGVNTLRCDGIGGLGSIFLGLTESHTVSLKALTSLKLSNSTESLLPKDPLSITLDGNTIKINIQDITSTRVNGLTVVQFAVLLVLHIMLGAAAFFTALPIFLALRQIQRISTITDGHRSTNEKLAAASSNKTQKSLTWQKRILLFAFLPLTVAAIIFGIAGMGNSRHFRTLHGITGLITFLLALASIAISFLRLRYPSPIDPRVFRPLRLQLRDPPHVTLPLLNAIAQALLCLFATISFVTGWSDLRAFTFCFAQAILSLPLAIFAGFAMMSMMVGVLVLVGLRIWLERRVWVKENEERERVEE